MRKLLIGLGVVGKSFLRLLAENDMFSPEEFYCADCDPSTKDFFLEIGGMESHFLLTTIEPANYKLLLDKVEAEGYVLDFGLNIKNLSMLEYCLQKGLHYLSLADASWPDDSTWINTYRHYVEYRKIKTMYPFASLATCVVEFGMNPGLVSCFMKQCINDIVNLEDSPYVRRHRQKLLHLLAAGKYNAVAKKLGIRYVVEIDNDTQQFSVAAHSSGNGTDDNAARFSGNAADDNAAHFSGNGTDGTGSTQQQVVYSPWSPFAFHMEMLSAPEIYYGTKKDFRKHRYLSDYNAKDGFAALTRSARECKESIYSPQGRVRGFLSCHEEIYSMGDYLKCGRYKPTVYFIYSPSELAQASVENNHPQNNSNYQILTKKDYLNGEESVGVILQGKHFKTRYFGNCLNGADLAETATVLQVSASAFAAYRFMLENPSCGLLFPEDLPHAQILSYAKKYLNEYISIPCPEITPTHGLDGFPSE